jgi:hypothetical protein
MRLLSFSIASATLSVLLAASPLPALAAEAAGLVLEVSGKTEPPLAAFAEIGADQAVRLDAGTTLKVVHYKSCRIVTLNGGTLRVGAADFDLVDGKVEGDQKTSCPRRVASRAGRAGEGGTGGIVMRGAGGGAALVAPAETFVLAGDKTADVKSVRLLRDKKLVAEWNPGKERSWTAPKDALKEGDSVTLVFTMKGNQPNAMQKVRVLQDAHEAGEPQVTVIRLD